jgi:hypothetical protein
MNILRAARSLLSTNVHITGLTGEGNTSRSNCKFANYDGRKRGFPSVAAANESSEIAAHNLNLTDTTAMNMETDTEETSRGYWVSIKYRSQNYCDFGLCQSSGILKARKYNASETGIISVLR